MNIGMFGYPGDKVERVEAMCRALRQQGAETLVCLGGIVWGGSRDNGEQERPATVLRWLRSHEIITLSNDTDRQVAGWRLQALSNTTGYILPRIRDFLNVVTREEAQWLYSRPPAQPVGQVLCCGDNLTIDALYPVPLTSFNANKLFAVLDQKAAFFPSANGPALLVRKEADHALDARKYGDVEEELDSPKVAGIVGGIVGHPPLNHEVSWGAVVDGDATRLSLVALDAKTFQPVREKATLLLQSAAPTWRG